MLASPPVAVVRGRQALIGSSYTSCSDPSMMSWRVALKSSMALSKICQLPSVAMPGSPLQYPHASKMSWKRSCVMYWPKLGADRKPPSGTVFHRPTPCARYGAQIRQEHAVTVRH